VDDQIGAGTVIAKISVPLPPNQLRRAHQYPLGNAAIA
jgi:hypothetical protein